mgnify:CR=1 FL=1
MRSAPITDTPAKPDRAGRLLDLLALMPDPRDPRGVRYGSDAPIACQASCRGEPGAVAGGEFFVGSAAEFEFSDPCWPHSQVCGGCGQGEVLGSVGWAQVGVVGHGAVAG